MSVLAKARKLARIVRSRRYIGALRLGVAAAIEHECVLQQVCWNTVVDIGANRGQFAIVARRHLPAAHIISFEPLSAPAHTFRDVFSSDKNVVLHQCAIGPLTEQAEIHVAGRDDSSSLLPIAPRQIELHPETAEAGRESVRVETLDRVLATGDIVPPALLKLDVQGYELECLRGCLPLLDKFTHLYVECGFQELYAGQALAGQVIAFSRENGFDLTGIYHLCYDSTGRAVDADVLFTSRAYGVNTA